MKKLFTFLSLLTLTSCSQNIAITYEVLELPVGNYSDYKFEQEVSYDETTIKILEETEDSYKINIIPSNLNITLPKGWTSQFLDSTAIFYSPDEKSKFNIGYAAMDNTDSVSFRLNFKKNWVDAFSNFSQQKLDIEQYEISEDTFALIAKNFYNEKGEMISMINIATLSENYPGIYLSFVFLSPSIEFENYLGLVGLILRDREVL